MTEESNGRKKLVNGLKEERMEREKCVKMEVVE